MTRTRNWLAIAGTIGLSTLALTVGTASAETSGARHCTLDTTTGIQSCFANYTDAISHASQGRVTNAPSDLRSALADPALGKELAADADTQGDVIQGTFFDSTDYSGNSLTISGTELCKKDGWVNFQYDLPDDWKNTISSVQPWGNCWLWLYPEPNLSGDRDGPFKENTANVGSFMDNRTQSIGFS